MAFCCQQTVWEPKPIPLKVKKKKSDSLNKKENEDLKSDINGLRNVYD